MTEEDGGTEQREQGLTDTIKQRAAHLVEVENSTLTMSLSQRQFTFKALIMQSEI